MLQWDSRFGGSKIISDGDKNASYKSVNQPIYGIIISFTTIYNHLDPFRLVKNL
jgi:hypothetical protein